MASYDIIVTYTRIAIILMSSKQKQEISKTGKIFTTLEICFASIYYQINLLKTKRNLHYIRNQFVPRSKLFPPWL